MCIEHDLSVIQNPKQHSKGRFLHYGQWIGEKPPSAQQRVRLAVVEALGKKPADFAAFLRLMEEAGFAVKHGRGGALSFLAPGQDKYTRLRASTLGDGFDPEDIRAAIAGERPIPELPEDSPAPPRRVNLIIDIQQRMAQGKGPAYERWAKVYNLKQMAAALQYLQEHNLTDYDELSAKTEAAVENNADLLKKVMEPDWTMEIKVMNDEGKAVESSFPERNNNVIEKIYLAIIFSFILNMILAGTYWGRHTAQRIQVGKMLGFSSPKILLSVLTEYLKIALAALAAAGALIGVLILCRLVVALKLTDFLLVVCGILVGEMLIAGAGLTFRIGSRKISLKRA